jgi:hypothetical protein
MTFFLVIMILSLLWYKVKVGRGNTGPDFIDRGVGRGKKTKPLN